MPRTDAYDFAAPRGSEVPWTRVYLRYGRVAHLRREDGSALIACDFARETPRYPRGLEDCWLGTGSQAEYEHAARLPLHLACFAARENARTREGYDPADPAERRRS